MRDNSFFFEDCIVLTGPELAPHVCTGLGCENGIITEINDPQPLEYPLPPLPVVLPALVNAHTHMGDAFIADGATQMTLEEGFFRPDGFKYRQLMTVDPAHQVAAMCDALRTMAGSGTIAHLDFREQGPYGASLLRRASEVTGVASIILGQIAQLPFTAEQLEANRDPLPESAADEFHELLSIADGVSESTINDLTDMAWRSLREWTDSSGQLRAIHCLENAGYREKSRRITGRGDLERALDVFKPHLIVHLTVADDEEIDLLAQSNSVAVLNPRANAALGLPLPPVRKLLEAGVPLLLGTDNGLLNSPNMFAELDFTYRLAKSQYGNAIDPDPRLILAMGTSNARFLEALGLPGYIAPGMPANCLLIDGSAPHLRYSRNLHAGLLSRTTPADVLATFRQGRPLYRRPSHPA